MRLEKITRHFDAVETCEACPTCEALSMGLFVRRQKTLNGHWICNACGTANPVRVGKREQKAA